MYRVKIITKDNIPYNWNYTKMLRDYKKLIYILTWPTFDAIKRWTTYFALFMKVEWKPIPNTSTVTIDEICSKGEKSTEENFYEKV